MTHDLKVDIGCRVVGEYVDEAEVPANPAQHLGEVVRPQVVFNYLDPWTKDDGIKEFIALLRDGRSVTVQGHSLKLWPATVSGESGSYGVVVRSAGEEFLVALFKVIEVVGIFHGELRSDRKIA